MAAKTLYAWTRIRAGGEASSVTDPLGRERRVIESRNVIEPGEKVTADAVGGQETLDQMEEAGSVRPYPFPENVPADESPINFLRRSIREAAEAQVSEEQQLLLAAGMGAVISDEELAELQATDLEEIQKATGSAAPANKK